MTLSIYYCSVDYIVVLYLLRCDGANFAAAIAQDLAVALM